MGLHLRDRTTALTLCILRRSQPVRTSSTGISSLEQTCTCRSLLCSHSCYTCSIWGERERERETETERDREIQRDTAEQRTLRTNSVDHQWPTSLQTKPHEIRTKYITSTMCKHSMFVLQHTSYFINTVWASVHFTKQYIQQHVAISQASHKNGKTIHF